MTSSPLGEKGGGGRQKMTLRWQMTGGEGSTMRYWIGPNFTWTHEKTEGISMRKGCSYKWRIVPDVRDPNLSSHFLVWFYLKHFCGYLVHNWRHHGGWEVYQKMTWWQSGWGCLQWAKKGWRHLCTVPNRGSWSKKEVNIYLLENVMDYACCYFKIRFSMAISTVKTILCYPLAEIQNIDATLKSFNPISKGVSDILRPPLAE